VESLIRVNKVALCIPTCMVCFSTQGPRVTHWDVTHRVTGVLDVIYKLDIAHTGGKTSNR
jgi:hypothetical protein